MEKKYIYYPFMVLAMTVALSSCDDFLDEMPDNPYRTGYGSQNNQHAGICLS